MLIVHTRDRPAFKANDACMLREILHPAEGAPSLPFSLARGRVDPGERTLRHRLVHAEVYYVLEGSGVMHVEEETRPIVVGDAIVVPPGAIQWVENPGRNALEFLCIVGPPWRAEDDQLA